jgi:transposase
LTTDIDEADKTVSFQRTTNILIMDNASWRKRKATNWHNWQPKYLPPYSPDFNPITKVTIAAFKTLEISNDTEQFIIEALRAAKALTISLVAEVNGCMIGLLTLP